MIKQTWLPHTADLRLKVEADTLEELFFGALQGMASQLQPEACRGANVAEVKQEFSEQAVDLTALLIDFLSQALTLSFEHQAVFCRLEVHRLTETTLSGCLYGQTVSAFHEDIKAVTYHNANVQQLESGNWETVIVFDV
jgi:SHS2 domain-containing protein